MTERIVPTSEVFLKIVESIASSTDIDNLLRSILATLKEVTDSDAASILLLEDGKIRVKAGIGIGIEDEVKAGYFQQPGEGLAGIIMKTGRSLYVKDVTKDPRTLSPFLKGYGIRSYFGVPILNKGESIGVLHIDWKEIHKVSQKERILSTIVADRCGAAIASAQQQSELKEAEARFRQLFDSAQGPVAIMKMVRDESGEIIDWEIRDLNLAAERMLGRSKKAVIGRRAIEALGERLVPGIELSNEIIATGKTYNFETDAWKGSFLVASLFPLGRDHLAFTGFDISEQKLKERQLAETTSYLENLLDYANAPIIVWDRKMRITRFNNAFERLTGLKSSEAVGRHLSILFPESTKEASLQHIKRASSGARWESEEIPVIGADSTIRTVLWNSATILDQRTGKVISTIAQGHDITERKRTETALMESEERFRVIAETSPVHICVSRASDGAIMFTNPAYDGAFGLAKGEAITWPTPSIYVDPSERGELLRLIKEKGYVRDYEVKVRRKDGTQFWIAMSVAPIQYDGEDAFLGASIDITERKGIEEVNSKHRAMLETIVNIMPTAVCIIRGSDMRLQLVNPNYQLIAPGKTMIGRTLNEIWSETGADFDSLCRKVLRTGESLHFEDTPYMIRRKPEGPLEKAYFTWSLDRVHLPGEEGWGILNTAWETTRRKEIENAIEEERDVLTFIINSIDDEVWFANVDGSFTLENPSAQTRFGIKPDAVDIDIRRMQSEVEVLRPDGTPRSVEEAPSLMALKGHKVRDMEEIVRIPETGELRYRQVTASPVRDADGNIIGSVSVVRDITERKIADEAILKAKEQMTHDRKRLEYILDAMPPAVAIVDASDRRFTYLNKRALELYGFDYVGTDLTSYMNMVNASNPDGMPLSPDEIPIVYSLTEGLEVRNQEMTIERGDGRRLLVTVSSAPLFDGQGNIASAIAIFEDITDRKVVERELTRSNAELEQFAYIASHDLKEPLRMISGFMGLLEQRYKARLDDEAMDYIHFAIDGAKRMNWLIEDLLQYSRIGRAGWNPEPLPMEEVYEQAVSLLAAQIADSSAVITRSGLPTLIADRVLMTSLVRNLIGNALKFHGPAPPRVHVSAQKEGRNWVFAVRDNGIGFPMEYQERIFLMFERLHSKDKYPGTGIGLALCRKIVERHGGRIWAESIEGEGSTFYFSLPENLGGLA